MICDLCRDGCSGWSMDMVAHTPVMAPVMAQGDQSRMGSPAPARS